MAVVGAGPAGMAATIQLVRSGHVVQVFEKTRVGGTLWNAGLVENYPGFPGGISGPELADQMEKQFLGYMDNVIINEVKEIGRTDTGFSIMGMDFDGVILCTGTSPKKAKFSGEDELAAAGLLHYGIAEIHNRQGMKDALVIGGGEASMDMALTLVKAGIPVTLLHRSEPNGILALKEKAFAEEDITWLQGEVKGSRIDRNKVIVRVKDRELAVDRVIVAVGREAAMPEFVDFNLEDPPPGLLVAGDAARGGLGQTAIAVGDGIEMAMIMNNYLGARD